LGFAVNSKVFVGLEIGLSQAKIIRGLQGVPVDWLRSKEGIELARDVFARNEDILFRSIGLARSSAGLAQSTDEPESIPCSHSA